jgi:quinol monooxygenase YgiN
MTGLFVPSLGHISRGPLALAGFGGAAAFLAAMTSFGAQKDGSVSSADTVVELRQYTLHPGERDVLIDVFEREFVEGQEVEGMRIVGTFRDLDNPDRFVWLRSFPDMGTRAAALNGFYHGPVWKAHSAVANATMVDAANVLLLRAARRGSGFQRANAPLPPRQATGAGRGFIEASIVYLRRSTPGDFVDFFEKELEPQWRRAGGSILATLVTDHSANNFSALPIREGENVFVWFSEFADQPVWARHSRALAESAQWRGTLGALSLWTHQPIEKLRLQPTARSRLQAVTLGGVE